MRLLNDTLRLLQSYPGSLVKLAKESGLPSAWLWKVKSGKTRNPGVIQLEKLHDFLRNASQLTA